MAKIVVNYGSNIEQNTYDTLSASDINSYLKKSFKVSIKPNLVVSRPANGGATTHTEIIEGIIRYLKDFGINNIKIIESSWIGDSTKLAYKNCGYEAISKRFNVPLIDLKHDSYTKMKHDGYEIDISNETLSTDFLINVPVLKAHCQTLMTCCMKNLKGCVSDKEKRKFHSQGIHKPVAALNVLLKTGYCVVDGICGDLSFEEGGNPVQSNRIIAGQNPLLVDSYCAGLIGYSPDEIEYLRYGKQLGLGVYFSDKTELLELNIESKPPLNIKSCNAAKKYEKYILEDSACSACYSSLIYALHRMDTKSLAKLNKLCIGQGYKNKSGLGTGIGTCTKNFPTHISGCPPKAIEIFEALSK